MSKNKMTLSEVDKEIKKTEQLLSKLRSQRANPGLPLHLAPKGKKSNSKSKTKSKPKSKSKSKPKSKSKSKPKSKPKSKSKSKSKEKSRLKTRSKSRSKTRSKSRSKGTLMRQKPSSISNKRNKLKEMGVDPRQLFGLDDDEINELFKNIQNIKTLAADQRNFLPPDDSPPLTPFRDELGYIGPTYGYDHPPGEDPYNNNTLQRTALGHPGLRERVHIPQQRPRFG